MTTFELFILFFAVDVNTVDVIRSKENISDPNANSGIALGDNDLYEITGRWNLESFRVIGIEAGKSHVLRVQYYQSPQNA